MADTKKQNSPSKPNITTIRSKDGVKVYDNETRKVIVDTTQGETKTSGRSSRGQTSAGETVAVDQLGKVYVEEKGKEPVAISRPVGSEVQQNGYTYKVGVLGSFETVKRPEEAQKYLDETIGINKRINLGENIKAKELAYSTDTLQLQDDRVASQSGAVEYQRQERETNEALAQAKAKAERQVEAIASFGGLSPVSSQTQKPTFADTQGNLFQQQNTKIGSNVESVGFVPFKQSGSPQPVKERFTAFDFKKKAFEYGVRKGGQALDYANAQVRTTPVVPTQRLVTDKPFTFGQALDYAKQGSTRVFNKDFGAKVVANINSYPLLQGVTKVTGEKSFTDSLKVTKPAKAFAQSTSNVAGEFISYASEKPVTTAFNTFGLRGLIGKTAYGVFDKVDVGQSVVGEGVKGFLQGGPTEALARAVGGYAGERVSDKTIGVFDMRPSVVSPTFSATVVSPARKTPTFIVSPKTTTTGKVSLNRFSVRLGVTPSYSAFTKLPSKKSLVADAVPRGPLFFEPSFSGPVMYESALLVNDVTPFGKSVLPKAVTVDLNSGVLNPTRRTLNQRPSLRSTRFFPNRTGLFTSKRGQMSLFGTSDDSYQDFAGRYNSDFGGFTGARPSVISPVVPPLRAKPVVKTKKYARSVRSFGFAKTPTLSFTQSNVNAKSLFNSKVTPFTMGNLKTNSNSVTNSLTRALSQTQSQTQSQTISPSITQSISQTQTQTFVPSLSRTLTQTLTQTQTRTPTISITPTITITPTLTLSKLTRQKGKDKAFGINKFFKGSTKYTPTAFAVGFNIKGKKLKGRLTGLEFRGVQ